MATVSLDIVVQPLGDAADLAPRWQALEARAEGVFFLGWTWMGSWLAATGTQPEVLTVRRGGEDVALALIGRSRARRPLGRVPALWLNQAGGDAADRVFIEYNGLLTARDAPDGMEQAAMTFLAGRKDWRVLRLGGVTAPSPLVAAGAFRRRTLVEEMPAWFVDLDAVRAAGGDYLSLLSTNSRSQIRRSMREYGEAEAQVERAGPGQVEHWLADMRALNAGRHADNAWEEPLFRDFAQALTLRGLDNGEVELLRIAQGGHLLGYLLNFVYRGQAMNYQSAFAPGLSAKAKPGLMCHAAAVARYSGVGCTRYSLLAGRDRYKQSLSTGHDILQWWDLERFSPLLEAEHVLRKLFRRPVSG